MKPYYNQVVGIIGDSQDGGKVNIEDAYGQFLHEIINNNTSDDNTVDIVEVRDNLRYAIHEFSKALVATETLEFIQRAGEAPQKPNYLKQK